LAIARHRNGTQKLSHINILECAAPLTVTNANSTLVCLGGTANGLPGEIGCATKVINQKMLQLSTGLGGQHL
jgi:hypothetical protein